MNRENLTNYIFDFWNNWGAFNYEERTDYELKKEIGENLKTMSGILRELRFLKHEFESGWSEESLEYRRLLELENKILCYALRIEVLL